MVVREIDGAVTHAANQTESPWLTELAATDPSTIRRVLTSLGTRTALGAYDAATAIRAAAGGGGGGGAAAQCPESAPYMKILDTAAALIYDPKSLGNLSTLLHKYDCQIHSDANAATYANDALKVTDDPHTLVYPPEMVRAAQAEIDGHLTGIGIIMGQKPPAGSGSDQHSGDAEKNDGPVSVRRVLPGSPAEKAGIKPGDVVIGVNGQNVKGKSVFDIASITRGASGTSVELQIERNGKVMDLHAVRQDITYPVVTDTTLPGGIAYIRVDNFLQTDLADQMKAALQRHADAPGYIIDMRDNPGGLIRNAFNLAEMFINDGKLTTIRARQPSDPDKPQYTTSDYYVNSMFQYNIGHSTDSWLPSFGLHFRQPDLVGKKPVEILVNGNTASAAEIFTSAVHDVDHATVIGETTFGKGIGQTIIPGMPGGTWLSVTSLQYYTPNGKWLGDANKHRIGITPDVAVAEPENTEPGSAADVQLNRAVAEMRRKLTHK